MHLREWFHTYSTLTLNDATKRWWLLAHWLSQAQAQLLCKYKMCQPHAPMIVYYLHSSNRKVHIVNLWGWYLSRGPDKVPIIDPIKKGKKCLQSGISRASIWYPMCYNHPSICWDSQSTVLLVSFPIGFAASPSTAHPNMVELCDHTAQALQRMATWNTLIRLILTEIIGWIGGWLLVGYGVGGHLMYLGES